MPPKAKFTKEEIIETALEFIREKGAEALTARALGKKLKSSPRPIFTVFKSMDEVKAEVIIKANGIYESYLREETEKNDRPPYKSSGMGYIRFAKEEKELFKLLFMRDRSNEKITENRAEVRELLEIIMKNTGLSEDEAFLLHLEMWVVGHGIATMLATSYLEWDTEFIEKILSDTYLGVSKRFSKGEQQ